MKEQRTLILLKIHKSIFYPIKFITMKQNTLYNYISVILLLVTLSCNKPEAVLFEDKSTAAKANKTGWTATADSETPDGWENTGKASATIDGNIATYWHTNYAVVVPFPHWLLIDMKAAKQIISIDITNRQATNPNTSGMKTFKLEGSNDGISFTKFGDYNFAITNSSQSFPTSSEVAYRYIKITALTPQRAGQNHTFLAEIDVFTTK